MKELRDLEGQKTNAVVEGNLNCENTHPTRAKKKKKYAYLI